MRLFGQLQENLARSYLQQQGLSLVKHNFSSRFGEIDLIMLDGNILCFVEVKYRSSMKYGGAAASVTTRKQQKIIRTAQFFLTRFPHYQSYPMRFDTVFITKANPQTAETSVNWIKGAFYSA